MIPRFLLNRNPLHVVYCRLTSLVARVLNRRKAFYKSYIFKRLAWLHIITSASLCVHKKYKVCHASVTFCRWSGVLLMSLLIAVPPEVQINTHKIVKGVLYWTTTQQQLPITTVHTLTTRTVNYIRQLQNHDYIHMTTTTSYKSILLHVTLSPPPPLWQDTSSYLLTLQ